MWPIRNVKKKILNARFAVEVISILYISMFVYTAINKWSDITMFQEQTALMPLMTRYAHIIAWALPAIELIIALQIFFSYTRKAGLIAATILMTMFTLYITYMMAFYPYLPCSCGGFLQSLSWTGHLIFNSIYIMLGILALVMLRKLKQAPDVSGQKKYVFA